MATPASWFPDPFGRFEQRYFDGAKWTEQVISNGEETVDPLGVTVSVPFATPTSDVTEAARLAASGHESPIRRFLGSLHRRWRRLWR